MESQGDHTPGTDNVQAKPLAMSNVDFTGAIDAAVLAGDVDMGVHSLKDLPPDKRWGPDLSVGCHLPRASPLDVLVGARSLTALSPGARVGSSSVRRQAQLLAARSDLQPVYLRGNVQTRLDAIAQGQVEGLIMAYAGLERLGIFDPEKMVVLEPQEMLPGVAQGIICAVARAENVPILRLLRSIDNMDAHIAAAAERAVLDVVDGSAPWDGRPAVAAYMESKADGGWQLQALLAHPDGRSVLRAERRAPQDCSPERAKALGQEVGQELLDMAGDGFYACV
mmetsp:Transcript_71977/g.126832  ORF Transcript_71977/g.126832 Transcript_71977/m.126832 type:complete len:281 (-) Transcript_71977:2018-2860(-)